MRIGACYRHHVRRLPAFVRLAIFIYMALVLAGCSEDGGEGGNQKRGGSGFQGGAGGKGAVAGTANTADAIAETAAPATVDWTAIGAPLTGPYAVTIERDPGLSTHTIYRPELGDTKLPIIAWGEGACAKDGLAYAEFLSELTSHGFLIIADGPPYGAGAVDASRDGSPLIQAIDWAFKENERPGSQYFQKLDTTKVAAMGQSCGGLMTYYVAGDPRLTTIVIWNSGLFSRNQAIYDSLHTPMAMFIGGVTDMAYSNADADFNAITKNIPIFYGNLEMGHMATYAEDNGGEFARVGVAWLKWQLLEDQGPNGREMFEGSACGLCNTDWIIKKKNMP
jgi:hypothetical protein